MKRKLCALTLVFSMVLSGFPVSASKDAVQITAAATENSETAEPLQETNVSPQTGLSVQDQSESPETTAPGTSQIPSETETAKAAESETVIPETAKNQPDTDPATIPEAVTSETVPQTDSSISDGTVLTPESETASQEAPVIVMTEPETGTTEIPQTESWTETSEAPGNWGDAAPLQTEPSASDSHGNAAETPSSESTENNSEPQSPSETASEIELETENLSSETETEKPSAIQILSDAPNGVTEDGFVYTLNTEETGTVTASITGYQGAGGAITVPEMVEEAAVTEIADRAFSGCSTITSVILPNSLIRIGSSAFSGCQNLVEITIPGGITELNSSLFDGCTSLQSVLLPDQLTSIGNSVFSGCSSLTSIVIPDGVTQIGGSVFSGCRSLTDIALPDHITVLPLNAFVNCTELTTVDLPANLTTIEGSAFSGCSKLANIVIPDGVTAIGREAFVNCGSLGEITLPEGLTEIKDRTFSSCSSLISAALPSTLRKIGTNAFSGCSSLTELLLPEGLTEISSGAFTSCESLPSIVLPAGLTLIDANLFSGCSALSAVSILGEVTEIRSYAFSGCKSLERISLPETLRTIGNSAFTNCTGIAEISLPWGMETLGDHAFSGCTNLRIAVLPFSIASIGESAFHSCDNVTLIVDPDSYAEQYAIEQELSYQYSLSSGNDAVVQLSGDAPARFHGLLLTLTYGENTVSQRITDSSEYRFYDLPAGESLKAAVTNDYGDVLASKENLSAEPGETLILLDEFLATEDLSAVVYNSSSKDVTNQVSITWTDSDGNPYASGSSLKRVPVGKELSMEVSLKEALKKTYRKPEPQTVTVSEGQGRITLFLSPIAKAVFTGTVKDANGSPIKGASISLSQTVTEDTESLFTALTDSAGAFRLEALQLPSTIRVSAHGFQEQQIPLEDPKSETALGEIVLSELTGAMISLGVSSRKAAAEGTSSPSRPLASLDDLQFTAYNQSQGIELTDAVLQGKTLILPSNAAPGDEIAITAESLTEEFVPQSAVVTLPETLNTQVTFTLVQKGSVKASWKTSENDGVRLYLFDSQDRLVWSGSVKEDRQLQSDFLSDGTYTAVLMGDSILFRQPSSPQEFQSAGLTEGKDFLKEEVLVSEGVLTELSVDEIPFLDESSLYYTDQKKTVFQTNKTSYSVGDYLSVRASAAFKPEYADLVSDITWIFEYPEGLAYADATLSANSQLCSNASFEAGQIRVPAEQMSDVMRFCLLVEQPGTYSINGYLEFSIDGTSIRQPIGTMTVTAGELSFEMCEVTEETRVTASGTAPRYSRIEIYDNEVLVGQTTADISGNWLVSFELYEPYTSTLHKVYAKMTTPDGKMVKSRTQDLTYRYDPSGTKLGKVTMIVSYLGNEQTVVFDFQNQEQTGQLSYTGMTGDNEFTFLIEFLGDDLSRIQNVQLDVRLENGEIDTFPAVFDQTSGCWITTASYQGDHYLPVNLAVRYDNSFDPVFSREEQESIQLSWEELQEELENSQWQDVSEEDLEYSDSEELKAAYEEYQTAVNEIVSAYQDYQNVIQDYLGEVSYGENGFSTQQGGNGIRTETGTRTDMTPETLISEGYTEIPTDSGSPLYIKNDEDTGSFTIADPSTGQYEENTISLDTSSPSELDLFLQGFQDSLNENDLRFSTATTVGELSGQKYISLLEEQINAGKQTIAAMEADQARNPQQWTPQKQQALDKVTKNVNSLEGTHSRVSTNVDILGAMGKALSFYGAAQNADKISEYYYKIQELENIKALANGDPEIISQCDQLIGELQNQLYWKMGNMALDLALPFATLSGPWGVGVALADLGRGAWNKAQDDKFKKHLDEAMGDIQNKLSEKSKNPEFWKPNLGPDRVPIVDPSGYVYEAVPSNRLEGVTASCYEKVTTEDIYGELREEIVLWNAEKYQQVNPQVTKEDGGYAWDVPSGLWQVKVEKEGYETAYSDWLAVPPPHFDVNFGLVSFEAPSVENVSAYEDGIEITFSKYMRTSTLTDSSVTVTVNGEKAAGTFAWINGEPNPENTEEILASRIKFVPENPFSKEDQVTLSISTAAASYAGVRLNRAFSVETAVSKRLSSLEASAEISLKHGGSGTIELSASPAQLAAGKTVSVEGYASSLFALGASSVTLDEQGKASLPITALLPGKGEILFRLDGTDLTAQTSVTIALPEDNPAPHEHRWDEGSVTTPPSCLQDGVRTFTCLECKTTRTEPIEATGHSWDNGSVTTPPSCLQDGIRTFTCLECKETRTEPIKATGHSWDNGSVTKAPLCGADGVRTYTCTSCKASRAEVIPAPAASHTFDGGTILSAPGCENSGQQELTCKTCGFRKTETLSPAGHQWDQGSITREALCGEPGTQVFRCTVCGKERTETIPAPAESHSFGQSSITRKATCEQDGSRTLTCTVCGTQKTEAIKATGHTWSSWETTAEATVFQPAAQERQCASCQEKETRTTGKTLTPTMELSASSIPLKVKQKTSAITVSGLAKGDSASSWKSSNTKIVKVTGTSDGTCTITAMNRTGSAKITVTLKSGLSKKITVKVQKGTVKTKSLSGVKKRLTLEKGERLTLTPIRKPLTSQEKITYTSSDKKVVTVTSKGVLKAKRPGSAKITIKSGSKKLICTVKVPSPAVTKIRNVKTRLSLKTGKAYTLKPQLLPSGASAKITFTSSNKKVAQVNSKGKITAKKRGSAVITVKAGKIRVRCKVTVK